MRASAFHPSQGGTTGSDSGGRQSQRGVDVKFLQVMMYAAAAADYYYVYFCMSNTPYMNIPDHS